MAEMTTKQIVEELNEANMVMRAGGTPGRRLIDFDAFAEKIEKQPNNFNVTDFNKSQIIEALKNHPSEFVLGPHNTPAFEEVPQGPIKVAIANGGFVDRERPANIRVHMGFVDDKGKTYLLTFTGTPQEVGKFLDSSAKSVKDAPEGSRAAVSKPNGINYLGHLTASGEFNLAAIARIPALADGEIQIKAADVQQQKTKRF